MVELPRPRDMALFIMWSVAGVDQHLQSLFISGAASQFRHLVAPHGLQAMLLQTLEGGLQRIARTRPPVPRSRIRHTGLRRRLWTGRRARISAAREIVSTQVQPAW